MSDEPGAEIGSGSCASLSGISHKLKQYYASRHNSTHDHKNIATSIDWQVRITHGLVETNIWLDRVPAWSGHGPERCVPNHMRRAVLRSSRPRRPGIPGKPGSMLPGRGFTVMTYILFVIIRTDCQFACQFAQIEPPSGTVLHSAVTTLERPCVWFKHTYMIYARHHGHHCTLYRHYVKRWSVLHHL